MNRIILRAAASLALASIATAAMAHESAPHDAKAPAALREQKPWGIAGDAGAVRRTIELTMTDNMRFTPDRIDVREGEVVRLVVRNRGQMLHEVVLGTKQALDEHAVLMLKFPAMEHEEPYMAHVRPGGTGQIVWRFNRAGEFDFACLIAGHYQAGMTGKIRVSAAGTGSAANAGAPAAANTEMPADAAADMADAQVRKVDREAKKITLNHGPIRNLDMPAMTMVFQVAEDAMLDRVKAGDRIRFTAASVSGRMTVTRIEPLP